MVISNRLLIALGVFVMGCGGGGGKPAVEGEVGPAGGTVAAPSGPSLAFPAGALSGKTTVRISEDGDAPLPAHLAGKVWRLEPAGVTFALPVEVTLSISDTDIPNGARGTELLMMTQPDGGAWMAVAATLARTSGGWQLTARTLHFSRWALATVGDGQTLRGVLGRGAAGALVLGTGVRESLVVDPAGTVARTPGGAPGAIHVAATVQRGERVLITVPPSDAEVDLNGLSPERLPGSGESFALTSDGSHLAVVGLGRVALEDPIWRDDSAAAAGKLLRAAAWSDGALLAGGDDVLLQRDAGGAWSPIDLGVDPALHYVIAGLAARGSEVWAVGWEIGAVSAPASSGLTGAIWRRSGGTWSRVYSGPGLELRAVAAPPSGYIMVAGSEGTVLRSIDGSGFTPEDVFDGACAGVARPRWLAAYADGTAFALAGESGAFTHSLLGCPLVLGPVTPPPVDAGVSPDASTPDASTPDSGASPDGALAPDGGGSGNLVTIAVTNLGLPYRPRWAAVRDGLGAWQALLSTNQTMTFLITDPQGRYGFAMACLANQFPYGSLKIVELTTAEATRLDLDCENYQDAPMTGAPVLSGAIRGLTTAAECANIAMAGRFATVQGTCPSTAYSLPSAPGTFDVSATAAGRFVLSRGVTVSGNTTLDLDFAQAFSMDMRQLTLTATPPLTGTGWGVSVALLTAGGLRLPAGQSPTGSGFVPVNFNSLPAGRELPTDRYVAGAVVNLATSGHQMHSAKVFTDPAGQSFDVTPVQAMSATMTGRRLTAPRTGYWTYDTTFAPYPGAQGYRMRYVSTPGSYLWDYQVSATRTAGGTIAMPDIAPAVPFMSQLEWNDGWLPHGRFSIAPAVLASGSFADAISAQPRAGAQWAWAVGSPLGPIN